MPMFQTKKQHNKLKNLMKKSKNNCMIASHQYELPDNNKEANKGFKSLYKKS